ncbi:MAG: Mrp/NBP35 family ATP-binding protein [Armatimonadetes bacterium]|nr:Mrp/NBP35 family ATP-binding protein [Armatimonadota bacterium]
MAAQSVTDAQVLRALSEIVDPDLHRDIVTLGFVKELKICGGNVAFTIELTTPACPVKERFRQQATQLVMAVDGVQHVEVKMTSNVRGNGAAKADGPAAEYAPGVKHTIAVTSGKGGVGKSTVAANVAAALKLAGAQVGLLDADVYGPSVPTMFGVAADERPVVNQQEMIVPLYRHDVPLMSIGFLVEEGAAMIMRGPMLSKFVQDALARVDWGELDYLIIDLPPGTGDVQLTLAQTLPLTGAVVVTTPQKVALADVRRAVTMCEKLNVPVLGLVENMSDPVGANGERIPVFGRGGGEAAARDWRLQFLGEVPLDSSVPVSGDAGDPIVFDDPDSPTALIFKAIAGRLAAVVSTRTMQGTGVPTMRIVD